MQFPVHGCEVNPKLNFFRDLFVAICYDDGVRRLVYPIYYAHAFDVCLTNLTSA